METIAKSPPEQQNERPQAAYFNRELSWLAFNRRVLEQACDSGYPVLERLRFLSFVSSNLDEFYEIRVAGLIQQVESEVLQVGPDGLGPKEQLRRIHNIVTSLIHDQYDCWLNALVPALRDADLEFKNAEELTIEETAWINSYFEEQVYPVLTPLAIDPAHPFPQLGNKTLNILVLIEDPSLASGKPLIAIIPVPRILPRVVFVNGTDEQQQTCIFLSDILKIFAEKLFPGHRVLSSYAFRITRNSNLYIDDEEVENLLQTIEEELHKLRKGAAVRLEIEAGIEQPFLDELLDDIGLSSEHVYRIEGPINLWRLMSVYELIDRPDLKFRPFIHYVPPPLARPDELFSQIAEQDFLLHHPYDSFTPIVDFVQQAAHDPQVLAIKLTLYRTSDDSPIVMALMDAARNGKQVTALIELKARFDEAQNIEWARQLEDAGVHVVYGLVGLKTHCKCCLVVRRETEGLKRYVHLGTGNYHPNTARLYTDLSFFTCDPETAREVAEVFNTLTGFARSPTFKRLLVAPYTLHSTLQKYILTEARNARQGLPARIIVKANSLLDKETIDNLYAASQAGVEIELIIRGICCLVPGVKGLSENIRIRSILGRHLEHSRIFYFENSGDESIILAGSADWMPRNFYRRIEVIFPIDCPKLRKRIVQGILEINLRDSENAKFLQPNGAYNREPPNEGEPFSSQGFFIEEAERLRVKAEKNREVS